MRPVDRITLVSADGCREHLVGAGRATQIRTGWVVKASAAACPSWTSAGVEVVAADADGNVVCAFTAERVLLNDLVDSEYHGQDAPKVVFRPADPHAD